MANIRQQFAQWALENRGEPRRPAVGYWDMPQQYGPPEPPPKLPEPAPAPAPGTDFRPEGWDYQTATTGMNGEPLPEGALSWDNWGRPFYGEGLSGWAKGFWANLTAPMAGADAGPSVAWGEQKRTPEELAAGAAYRPQAATPLDIGKTWENIKAGTAGAPIGYASRTTGAVIGAGLSFIGEPAKKFEQTLGMLTPIYSPSEWLDDFDFSSAFRFTEGGLPFVKERSDMDAAWQAARIAYSGYIDPVRRADFMRRYQAGESATLLQAELEIPLVEMVGQIILDPLNLIGGGVRHARDINRLGDVRDIFLASKARVSLLDDVARAASEAEAGEKMTAVLADIAAQGERIEKGLAEYAVKRVPWMLTSSARQFNANRQAGEVIQAVAAASFGKPDDMLDAFRAMYDLASKSPLEQQAGLAGARGSRVSSIIQSDAAMELGKTMRRSMENVGGVDNFIAGLQTAQSEGVEAVIEYAAKTYGKAVSELFPSVDDILKAEKAAGVTSELSKVSPALRSINAFHNFAQAKGYGWLNQAFSTVYMGLSPAYAARNMMQNALQATIDYGFGPLWHRAGTWDGITAEWLGHAKAATGFGAAIGSAGVKPSKIAPFLGVSEKIEQGWAAKVIGHTVQQSMVKQLRVLHKSIVADLVKGGKWNLSPEEADQLGKLVIANKGDWQAALDVMRGQMQIGAVDAFRNLEWLDDPAKIKQLQDGGYWDDLLRIGRDAPDGNAAAVKTLDLLKEEMQYADTAVDDVVGLPATVENADEIADIAQYKATGAPDVWVNEKTDAYNHNRAANDLYNKAFGQAVAEAQALARGNPELQAAVDAVITGNRDLLDNTFYPPRKQLISDWGASEAHRLNGILADIKTGKTSPAAAWKSLGMSSMSPTPDDFYRRFHDEYYFEAIKKMYAGLRDELAARIESAVDALRPASAVGVDIPDAGLDAAREQLVRAQWFDQYGATSSIARHVSNALADGDKALAARYYAKQYGIATISGENAAALDEKLLNIINKYMPQVEGQPEKVYAALADVDPEDTRLALVAWANSHAPGGVRARVADEIVAAVPPTPAVADNIVDIGGMRIGVVPADDAAMHNVYISYYNHPEQAVTYKGLQKTYIVENGKVTADKLADYLESKGLTVTGRPPVSAAAAAAAEVVAPFTDTEFYMWRANKEGGQVRGNAQTINAMNEKAYDIYIRPKLSTPETSFAEWRSQNPDATHYSLVGVDKVSKKGARAGTDWKLDGVGTPEELRPSSEWARQVTSMADPEGEAWRKVADSDLPSVPVALAAPPLQAQIDAANRMLGRWIANPIDGIESGVREAMQQKAGEMLAAVEQGVAGERIFAEGKFSHATHSTYPSWYGPLKISSGKRKKVLKALNSIIFGGGLDDSDLAATLKDLILDDLISSDPRVMMAMGNNQAAHAQATKLIEEGREIFAEYGGHEADRISALLQKDIDDVTDTIPQLAKKPELAVIPPKGAAAPAKQLPDEVVEEWNKYKQFQADSKHADDVLNNAPYQDVLHYADTQTERSKALHGGSMQLSAVLKKYGLTRDDVRAVLEPGFVRPERVFTPPEPIPQNVEQLRMPIPPRPAPAYHGAQPSGPRLVNEQRAGITELLEEVADGMRENWGRTIPSGLNRAKEGALSAWAKAMAKGVPEARLTSSAVANVARDFTLLSYPEKTYMDLAAGYVMPYHFWYNRTYANWLKRVVSNPEVIAGYAKYREALAKIHAGAPEWWKYNINSNELLGLDSDNPLFFNLESTLNPLQGLTGVDFNDRYKRVNWFTKTLDDLGKFGPTTFTPFSMLTAFGLSVMGDRETDPYQAEQYKEAAARWAGRLIPQTALIKSVSGLMGVKGGLELDPMVHLFSGGLDPYERGRVGRALATMVANGEVDEASALDAGRSQSGPVWEEAKDQAMRGRAAGNIAASLAGVGFRARNLSDIQIDKFYSDYYALIGQEPNLAPVEYRRLMDDLRTEYPFMDTLLLARKGGITRDRTFAYNVLGRIPPGQRDDYARAAGIPPELFTKFYDEKGHIEKWQQSDRERFTNAIVDMAALLDVPDDATRGEWNAASGRNSQMYAAASEIWGADIWDKVDRYYAMKGDTPQEKAAADAFLAQYPEVSDALDWKSQVIMTDPLLQPYYASIGLIEQYYNGAMYDKLYKQFPGIGDAWDGYFAAKLDGTQKAYWKAHPELEQYMDLKEQMMATAAQRIVDFAQNLPEGEDVRLRPNAPVTYGQEQVAAQAAGQMTPYTMTWTDFQPYMSDALERLVQDYAFTGDPLSNAAEDQLGTLADNLGVDYEILLELLNNAALQSTR